MVTTLQEAAQYRSLYELTGDIKDFNTMLVPRTALAQQREQQPVCHGCGIPAGDVHMSTCKSGKWPSRVSNGDTAAPAPQAQPVPQGERAELIRKLRREVTWVTGRHYATQLEEIMDEAAAFLQSAQPEHYSMLADLEKYASENQGTWIFPGWDGDRVLRQLSGLQSAKPERVGLSDEQSSALTTARITAMDWAAKGRIPECGEFGAIAQNLDWLWHSFQPHGIKPQGEQHNLRSNAEISARRCDGLPGYRAGTQTGEK